MMGGMVAHLHNELDGQDQPDDGEVNMEKVQLCHSLACAQVSCPSAKV